MHQKPFATPVMTNGYHDLLLFGDACPVSCLHWTTDIIFAHFPRSIHLLHTPQLVFLLVDYYYYYYLKNWIIPHSAELTINMANEIVLYELWSWVSSLQILELFMFINPLKLCKTLFEPCYTARNIGFTPQNRKFWQYLYATDKSHLMHWKTRNEWTGSQTS